MFLRKGATYNLLGDTSVPISFEDNSGVLYDPAAKRFVLDQNSLLKEKLCQSVGGECKFANVSCFMCDFYCWLLPRSNRVIIEYV